MIILGIDPGKSGACAVLTGPQELNAFIKLDSSERDISDFIRDWTDPFPGDVFAYIEKVHAFPKIGVVSTFNFGVAYGFLRGLLIAHRVPFDEISPVKWMNALSCRTGGDKNITRSKAQQLFPSVKCTHYLSDALLIGHYAWRLRTGTL